VIVAPDAERSAVGHAITTLTPLRVKEFKVAGKPAGYAVSGTPADCVKLAVGALLGRRPDLVVSGINLGPNTATNVIYSGTVSAATEARILGVPSIAVSLGTFADPIWQTAASYARRVPLRQVKGIAVTRQGVSAYEELYDLRLDPRKVPYYWAAGSYRMSDVDPQSDALALHNGYVSVTPITFDLTAHTVLDEIRRWRFR